MTEPDDVMEAVERIMSVRLEWGVSDCASAACDVFHALHGIDPMGQMRGAYTTPGGAARQLVQWGGFLPLAEAMALQTGLATGLGQPGEIGLSREGLTETPDGRTFLICIEPGAWAGKTEMGYAIVSEMERCWRV